MNHIRRFGSPCYVGVVTAVGALLLAGCGRGGPEGPPRVKTVPVTGQVNVDGKPQSLLAVRAKPVSGETPTASIPSAFTDENGRFSLSTYESGDGVPVGDYKLIFQWGQVNMMTGKYGGDKFNGKYADPEKSEYSVKATETSEPIDVGVVELSTKDLPPPPKKADELFKSKAP